MNKIILLLTLCFVGVQATAQADFITTWKTDNPGVSNPTSINISTLFGETYSYDVSWKNDGIWENEFTGDAFHDYGTAGTYEVAIRGTFPQIYFDFYSDREKILSIEQWGTNSWSSMAGAFNGCSNLIGNATDIPNLSVVEDMSGMFTDAIAYNADMSDWDVSNVKYMEGMFSGATSFDQNIGTWDVSNVVSMGGMFGGVTLSTANYDALLNGWSNLTLQNGVSFSGGNSKYCYGRTARDKMTSPPFSWDIIDGGQQCAPTDHFITTWNTDNPGGSGPNFIIIPTFPGGTYSYDVSWKNDGVWETDFTGDATHDYGMAGIYEVAIRGTFPQIYFNDSGDRQKILTIEQWGTNGWDSMESAFNGCSNLIGNAPDIPDLSNVTDMSSMFKKASSFNQNISSWNVGSVIDMSDMFLNAASFNQNIGNWNVGKVTNMSGMFSQAASFNQNIGSWDVSKVTDMSAMFTSAGIFNQDIGNWDVSNVTDMSDMFNTTSFNQNIGNWNVENVTTMNHMFSQASFNQDIGTWNVGNVTDMQQLFYFADEFDQNIGTWDVSNVTEMTGMFDGVTLSTANYDALLIGWSNLNLQTGINFSGGDSKYCYGRIARDKMTSPPFSWSITDGGQLCVPTDYFITTWKTDNPLSGPVAILIPTHPDEIYDYDVSWKNDGIWETGFTGDAFHDYGVAGEYTVEIGRAHV